MYTHVEQLELLEDRQTEAEIVKDKAGFQAYTSKYRLNKKK